MSDTKQTNPVGSSNRRQFLKASGLLGLTAGSGWAASARSGGDPDLTPPRYRIGVCDWMILKRQKLSAFKRAQEIGADGLEVDMGGLGSRDTFDNKLLDPVARAAFKKEAQKCAVDICSIALSGFYAQSFAERETVPLMVRDSINTMVMMGVGVAFLPLGVQGDLVAHPELRPAIVDRLKMAGELAEAAGVVIGIETALPAAEEVALLEDVGSSAIRSYFNFANALQNGRNLIEELETLGKDRIVQIHCTDEDGVWLENNERLDLVQVRASLDRMGWSGWLVMERSRDASNPRDVVGNFGANARYLKQVFQTSRSS